MMVVVMVVVGVGVGGGGVLGVLPSLSYGQQLQRTLEQLREALGRETRPSLKQSVTIRQSFCAGFVLPGPAAWP